MAVSVVAVALLAAVGVVACSSVAHPGPAVRATASRSPDPTAGWTPFSSAAGRYSLRYPPTWLTAAHPELCNPGWLLLGPTEETVGKCATEYFGQVFVIFENGDTRAAQELAAPVYTGVKSAAVKIGGVAGNRQTGSYVAAEADSVAGPSLPDGTKVVRYTAFAGGRTYVIGYDQAPGFPDVQSDVDLLVTRTLRFQ